MFFSLFNTTFLAIFQILIIGLVGYVLVRKRIVNETGLNLLTRLVVNIFLPSLIFVHLIRDFSFQKYSVWWMIPLLCWAIILTGVILSVCLFGLGKNHLRDEFNVLLSFQNSGYLPLPIVTALFVGEPRETLYVYIFLFGMGFDLALWTLGVWLLTRHKTSQVEMKNIFNPPFVTTSATLLLIALGLHHWIPDTFVNSTKMLGDCAIPLSMIILGGNLALTPLRQINRTRMSLLVVLKLIVMPILGLAFVLKLNLDFLLGFLVMLETSGPSAVTLSVLARHYKHEDDFINQGVFVTHVLSALTISFFLALYTQLRSS